VNVAPLSESVASLNRIQNKPSKSWGKKILQIKKGFLTFQLSRISGHPVIQSGRSFSAECPRGRISGSRPPQQSHPRIPPESVNQLLSLGVTQYSIHTNNRGVMDCVDLLRGSNTAVIVSREEPDSDPFGVAMNVLKKIKMIRLRKKNSAKESYGDTSGGKTIFLTPFVPSSPNRDTTVANSLLKNSLNWEGDFQSFKPTTR